MTPRWTFPASSNDTAIGSATYPSVELNNSVISYLRRTASNPPREGVSPTRPVHTDDIIDLQMSIVQGGSYDEWCLVCTATYSGKEGWDACNNFTDPETTELLYHDNVYGFPFIVGRIDNVVNRTNSAPMSAAVCSFGVANPLANPKFSPNYDLGVPYPLIYADRKTVTGEDRYYRFSSDNPDGEAVETLSESEYSTVVEHENNNNIRGHIVGGVIGGVAFIVIFVAIPLWLWLRNRRAKNTAIIAPGQKLGETRRQPSIKASDDPPPAYEQIATPAPIYQQSST